MAEVKWQKKALHAYLDCMLAHPFKRLSVGVIMIGINVQGHRSKLITAPGASELLSLTHGPLTISSPPTGKYLLPSLPLKEF